MRPFVFIIILLSPLLTIGQQMGRLHWAGSFSTDHRFFTLHDNEWAWNETRLDLQPELRTGKARFHATLWLRHLGTSVAGQTADLYNKDKINPWNLDMREAYVEVRGFLTENLDLKVGRQRIAWGTADKFNPTDNLNPNDWEDIIHFDRRNGSEAVNLQYYFGNGASLQVVYVPFFRPANLPLGKFARLFQTQPGLPAELTLEEYTEYMKLPRHNLKSGASAGVRFKSSVGRTDVSLSYTFSRDHIPVATYASVSPVNQAGGVSIHTELLFPRHHIIGADIAGQIGNVGAWAEAALFIPNREIILHTDFTALFPNSPIPVVTDSLMLKKDPYLKFVAGFDYTFRNGIYLNVQAIRGFVHERGHGNMNDYLLIGVERSFWNNQVLIRPLAGGLTVTDWGNIPENYALFYMPEITYKGIDNLEIGFGAGIFAGEGGNLFALMRTMDIITGRLKFSF